MTENVFNPEITRNKHTNTGGLLFYSMRGPESLAGGVSTVIRATLCNYPSQNCTWVSSDKAHSIYPYKHYHINFKGTKEAMSFHYQLMWPWFHGLAEWTPFSHRVILALLRPLQFIKPELSLLFAEKAPIGLRSRFAFNQLGYAFADTVKRIVKKGQFILAQDLQTITSLPLVRKEIPEALIAWSCHVPFPEPPFFRKIPGHKKLIEDMLSADVITFNANRDCQKFLRAVEDLKNYSVDRRNKITAPRGRRVRVLGNPVGVPIMELERTAQSSLVRKHVMELSNKHASRQIIFGAERCDYTKGIFEKLLAFSHLLEEQTSRGKLRQFLKDWVLVQVAVPTRIEVPAYRRYRNRIKRLIENINNKFAMADLTPVVLIEDNLSIEELVAYYLRARIALITPLCDGQNLVAHEFCVVNARKNEGGPGVLVLSRGAGAAELLEGTAENPGAIIVALKTGDCSDIVTGLKQAMKMAQSERERRSTIMRERVRDIKEWISILLQSLHSAQSGATIDEVPIAK